MKWQPSSYQISSGQIISNGQVVGTITGDSIHAEFTNLQAQMKQVFNVNLTDGALIYREVWLDVSGAEKTAIQGTLTK